MTFNVTALILAIAGVWDYPRRYTGAMVLGNLYTAILIRNELFGRFLYLIVNTCFAKVRDRCVVTSLSLSDNLQVASSQIQTCMHIDSATPWRHPFGLRNIRIHLAHLSRGCNFNQPCPQPRFSSRNGGHHKRYRWDICCLGLPLGQKHSPQVSFTPK